MRPINLIVIHCAATPNGDSLFRGSPGTPGQRTPVQAIDAMHQARGFRRSPKVRQAFNPQLAAIGYHFVLYTNGAIVTGRAPAEIGAHVQGHNVDSLGICLVGTDKFSPAQWESLRGVVDSLAKLYPAARIVGHRDLSPDTDGDGKVEPKEWIKVCPGFDVGTWLAGGMAPLTDHLLETSR
ncbi:N-acetylmuramoyl-L-alanine amidase [Rhodocyclus tenuis]|uniref:N-acetyl-anhydromuramyl-L-alanine amidase AmpD n=1 Tax=Rhodocyclus tenuis TaxID=1066 RepID=A0A840G9A6_RHOTE|nr:N-acetylmuramoyl-L-alanine amidase [Rhodocyclus tenuis]MBB4247268.1 N-acetyl-anhydromuramyl-L-alanine amidase AmpD [Rhodocyclus tenuis]